MQALLETNFKDGKFDKLNFKLTLAFYEFSPHWKFTMLVTISQYT